jgi:stage V sporulation protein G
MSEDQSGLKVARFHRIEDQSNLRGFCDVVVNEELVVKGVKVMNGKNGLFVSMPARRAADGKWYDMVFPITRQAREELHRKVLSAYEESRVAA